MNRIELRIAALERAGGRCEWEGCTMPGPLEMAHITGVGAGGSKYRDELNNVVMFCRHHHDWLDCRIIPNMRRFENSEAVRIMLGRR